MIGTGKAVGMPILTAWFTTEPSTDPTIIPTRETSDVIAGDIMRFMRIYYPRTYEDLLEYEFFFLAQVDMTYFSARQQKWLYDALTNFRKGGVNTRSAMSINANFYQPWIQSMLSDTFPNDADAVLSDSQNFNAPSGPLIVKDGADLPGIMKPYKAIIEKIFPYYTSYKPNFPLTIPKQGSTILSYTKNNQGIGSPVPGQIPQVFYWSWNQSTTFTFRGIVYDDFWSSLVTRSHISNPYSLDIITNMVWFSTGRRLPEDPYKVHEFRRDLFNFGIQQNLLTSLLDFAEIFGANPVNEHARLNDIQGTRIQASNQYLDRDFDTAYDTMKTALQGLTSLEEDAAKLKDRAMLWVYIVEWLVTTAVFLVTGSVLWTLMVKQKLYRDVTTTTIR